MLIAAALEKYGMAEVPGSKENPEIVQMSKDLDYPFGSELDSWCGIFMAHSCKRKNLPYPDKAYRARSWLSWGIPVSEPKTGDIVVFWRESKDSWKGHVGIYVNRSSHTLINVLGGNQNDRVCIMEYSLDRVLGFRRLV